MNLASIFSDDGVTPLANPFTADANGFLYFYAANGDYDVRLSGGGIVTPYTWGDISLGSITSINGLAGPAITITTGSAGTDFAAASAGSTVTLNLPSASALNRGAVTTGAQTFAGAKTFSTPIAAGSGGSGLDGSAAANGSLLIGNGAGYSLATLTAGANAGVTIANGAGTITLSTVQDIRTTASPSFTGLTVSGLTANAPLYAGVGGALTTLGAMTNGQVILGSTGAAPVVASLTAGANITLTPGAGSLTIAATASGITSLNGLAGASQTFAVATTGTDFTISSAGTTHTFAIPDASTTARGLVTTGTQSIAGTKTFTTQPHFTAGTGSGDVLVSGVISSNVTPVGNVGAGVDDLMTYTLPANTLTANAKALRISAGGRLANNTNAKRVIGLFGGTELVNRQDGTAATNHTWHVQATVLRTGAATQVAFGQFMSSSTADPPISDVAFRAAPTATLSSTVVIKFTGEAASDDDIIQDYMLIEVLN